jgi:hypothetical protein
MTNMVYREPRMGGLHGLMLGAIFMPARWKVATIALKSGYRFLSLRDLPSGGSTTAFAGEYAYLFMVKT